MTKKILYVDMDNVIVNFQSGIDQLEPEKLADHIAVHGYNDEGEPRNLDEVEGIFGLMKPMPDAIESITELSKLFNLFILSTSPWNNPSAWIDKISWVHTHFGIEASSPVYKRLILSHHKNLNDGHYLVDDREANGAQEFGQREGSEHIHFGQGDFQSWESVVEYLKERK
jgi:5'(3')-deoxyribonucleotidase